MSTVVLKIRSVFRKSQHRFVSEFQNCTSKPSTLALQAFPPHTNQSAVKAKWNWAHQPWGIHVILRLNSHRKVATTQWGVSPTNTNQVSMFQPRLQKGRVTYKLEPQSPTKIFAQNQPRLQLHVSIMNYFLLAVLLQNEHTHTALALVCLELGLLIWKRGLNFAFWTPGDEWVAWLLSSSLSILAQGPVT